MIYGYLTRWEQEKHMYPAALHTAMQFLHTNLHALPDGKYPIEEDAIFGVVYRGNTVPMAEKEPELHGQYIDIHYVVEGKERYVVQPCPPGVPPTKDAMATADVAFYPQDPTANILDLGPGQYVVFLPWQQHTPCCAVGECGPLFKVILKIRADLIQK